MARHAAERARMSAATLTAAHPVLQTSCCRTSGSCPEFRWSDKTQSSSCRNRRERAGNCPPLRRFQGVRRRKRVRRDRDAARRVLHGNHYQIARRLRQVQPARLRRLPLWAGLDSRPSQDSLQKALSQNSQLFPNAETDFTSENIVVQANDLLEQASIDRH